MKAKKLLCLLFVVSIAYVGCADKKPSTVNRLETIVGWSGTMEEFSKLKEDITKLEKQLAEAGIKTEPDRVLMNQIAKLEVAVGSQKAEIDRLKKAYRQYVVVIESQRETIDSLQNLCRMYEDATKSLVKTIENTKNILEITSRAESNSKDAIECMSIEQKVCVVKPMLKN